jgi:hypothetical protein
MAVNKQEIEKLLQKYFHMYEDYSISDNGLVSVTGSIKLRKKCAQLPISFDRVGGDFGCEEAGLKTLVGAPRWVGGDFKCYQNQLTTLVGAPLWVDGFFTCWSNRLKSFKGIPLYIGHTLYFSYNEKMALCGLLTSKIKKIDTSPKIETIINKYLNTGYQGMLPFANELIRAGYGDNAWL